MRARTSRRRLALAWAIAGAIGSVVLMGGARAHAAAPKAKIEELCKALEEDSNYKVRVQAAIVLGKLADAGSIGCLTKALADPNKTVRGIAAQALGQIGDPRAADALRTLLQGEADPFVRSQADKALAALQSSGAGAGGNLAAGGAGGKKPKIFLSFGPFSGTAKNIPPEAAKTVHDILQRELGKLGTVTMSLAPADQKNFAKTGLLGFYIDGAVTRLDDTPSGGSSETSCDVKAQVMRWPSKSLISWTNAGASVQSGSRPRDKENARHDCLEASAVQLGEDLTKFLKLQGG